MAAPRYKDIMAFSRSVASISRAAQRSFEELAARVDYTDWGRAADEIRGIVEAVMLEYGPAAAELGAQWYEFCRRLAVPGKFIAAVGDVDLAEVRRAVDRGIDMLFDGKVTEVGLTSVISGTVADQIERHVRDTVTENLRRDWRGAVARGDKRLAQRCGYTRVPAGDACAFCVMLASAGPVYVSAKSATTAKDGDAYHDNCRCVAVPFAEASQIAGYGNKLEEYEGMYQEADTIRRSGSMPQELKDRIKDAKAEHERRYRAGETSRPWEPMNETTIIMRYMNSGLK